MNKIVRSLVGVGVLAGLLGSGAASAIPFSSGSISFSGGFDAMGSATSIVSAMIFIDVSAGAAATTPSCGGGATGATVCALPFGAFASDFLIGAPAVPMTYSFGGSTFLLPAAGFGKPVRTALSCTGGTCVDSLSFEATGFVSGPGYAPVAFAMLWNANGSCTEGAVAGQCGEERSATWSTTITARAIPEPGSLALIAIALVGLGLGWRRKQS